MRRRRGVVAQQRSGFFDRYNTWTQTCPYEAVLAELEGLSELWNARRYGSCLKKSDERTEAVYLDVEISRSLA